MSTPYPGSSPKKRKHAQDSNAGPSPKRSKKERKHKHRHGDEEFVLVKASLVVSIPPVFASNPSQGVEEMLDSMVMRYIPPLRGVVLTHSNIRFLQSTANIQGDSPYAICNVGFDATVWSPRVGQRLTGKINLCSPDHVSLLVHRTFNVSIPRHHIPRTEWVFEYGAAENDPEYGAGSAAARDADYAAGQRVEEAGIDTVPSETLAEGQDDHAAASAGRWVHAVTGLPLGSDSATLQFTVVGLIIANQMLSLVGSIQPDPFSPEHVAPAQDVLARDEQQDSDSGDKEKDDAESQKHKRKKGEERKERKRKKATEGKPHKRKPEGEKESEREKGEAADSKERKPSKKKKKKEDE
ncbi:hypothetical protein JB92DRAFT_2749925 [Gautieria morchelliformis]|nr:hypothetical protein JB92DRAFT_2749925 [Gautieria morchelliformis]